MRNIIVIFFTSLISYCSAQVQSYDLTCEKFDRIELKGDRSEGRAFDGILFEGDNGKDFEFYHPIKITTKRRLIFFEDPFGETVKTSISRIDQFATTQSVFDFVKGCEESSFDVLTQDLIDSIRANAFSPDLIVTSTGQVSAPNFSTAEISNLGSTSLITKEYTDANYAGGGGGFFFADTPTVCGNVGGKDVYVDGMAFDSTDFTITLNGNIVQYRLSSDVNNVGKTIIMEMQRYIVDGDQLPSPSILETDLLNRDGNGNVIIASDIPTSITNQQLYGGFFFQWYTID